MNPLTRSDGYLIKAQTTKCDSALALRDYTSTVCAPIEHVAPIITQREEHTKAHKSFVVLINAKSAD
jgi:hypothetical protein